MNRWRGRWADTDRAPAGRRRPAHEDGTPSLSIAQSGARVLVHRHAGCGQDRLLGTLLDALAHGLRVLPATRLPRMADFALWATAREGALWRPGGVWRAYDRNRAAAVEDVIDADQVSAALRTLMATRAQWTGTATELLTLLTETDGERVARGRAWPDGPRALGGRLRRVAMFLRMAGIELTFEREGRSGTRTIRLTATPPSRNKEKADAASAASAAPDQADAADTFDADATRTHADANDGDWQERAAILEHDHGLSRSEAELSAREHCETERAAAGR